MRTETFTTPGPVRLDIRNGAGEVRIEAGQGEGETIVTLEPLRDNEASIEAVQSARVELHEGADGQDVVVDVRGRNRFFRGAEVRIAVSCPLEPIVEIKTGSADIEGRGLIKRVDVETGSGDVQFSDISGDAEINAASGDVQIAMIGGEARINTASGDVQVGTIGGDSRLNTASGDVMLRTAGGRIEVNTASGDAQIKEALGAVTVNSASGDQQIGSVFQDSVNMRSASGDLRVGIKQGSRLFIDVRSRSGDVSSELPVSDVPPEGDAPLVELRANTMSGDITIHRAGS
jgi:DUF4097 and DUF4098 domain-containing protein YvlB